MRGLYLAFEKLSDSSGISKKIVSQKKALEYNGFTMELAYIKENPGGSRVLMVDDNVIINYGNGIHSKINYYTKFDPLFHYIVDRKIDILYIRYIHYATPFFVNFLKKMSKNQVRLFLEIPTYPYDEEYRHKGLFMTIKMWIEKISRKSMAKYLENIVTVSDDNFIFGRPTIRISNGIDIEAIKLRKPQFERTDTLRLVAVASISSWHGYDRLIVGLKEYYSKKQLLKVTINIVGGGNAKTIDFLKQLVVECNLSEYVFFLGPMFGVQLDQIMDNSDIAIGSLAIHRKGLTQARSLKNREYAVRGIPFIFSEIDEDFEGEPFVLKVPPDESPINIEEIIKFYQRLMIIPEEIRNSVGNKISWNVQMKKIAEQLIDIK